MFLMIIIDKFTVIHRIEDEQKTFFTVQKAFRSVKPSSVTKWIRFTQLFCFLSNIINCQEQLKTIQQIEKKKKGNFLLGSLHYVFNCSMWHHF